MSGINKKEIDLRDRPIEELENDLLDINKYANSLEKFIKSTKKPVTISIQGEWGSGKTSLM